MAEWFGDTCAECGGEVMDVGDELVCRICGVVSSKVVMEAPVGGPPKAVDFSGQSLGGYMGPPEFASNRRPATGLAGSESTLGYLKLVSDFAGREDSTSYACMKLIERVCEKLSLPHVVRGQALAIARKLYASGEGRLGASSGAVSAYAIVTACKMVRVTSVNVKEVLTAHRMMGKRVRFSSLVRLTLESPYRAEARRPEDYLQRVIARLSSNENFLMNLKDKGINSGAYFARLREASTVCLNVVDDPARGGHSPIVLAATAVYAGEALLSSLERRGMRITQKAMANSAGVAEYTLREQYGELFRPTQQLALIRATQIRRR